LSSGTVKGEVKIPFKTVLAYPVGRAGTGKEAYLALIPESAVTVTFEGPGCGLVNRQSQSVKGSGTEITEPAFNKRCGLLAEVGRIEAGSFVKTASGAQSVEGALNLPGGMSPEAELWQPATQTYKRIKCTLQGGFAAVPVTGQAKLEVTLKEEFGWQT
jgi:hypothetical protein